MLKVLIAEDDLMMADMVEDVLTEHGYEVCGTARTVAEAVALGLHHKPDLAVIDLRLAENGLGIDIATQLSGVGRLGVLYATGNTSYVMLNVVAGHGCISKPYRLADLLRSLEIVAEVAATGAASQPFPLGFQLLPAVAARAQRAADG